MEIEKEGHDCDRCSAIGNCPMESIMRDTVAFEDDAIDALVKRPDFETYLSAVEKLDYARLMPLIAMHDSEAIAELLSQIRVSGLVRGYALRRNKELELMLER